MTMDPQQCKVSLSLHQNLTECDSIWALSNMSASQQDANLRSEKSCFMHMKPKMAAAKGWTVMSLYLCSYVQTSRHMSRSPSAMARR
jgi:hypothetical protein